ncbi:hypothetical protein EDF82_1824 [Raoultella sp. BIGb0399]|nr:hypothetical protein EDF82_1824 [Raoultella sp. BIGb0399]
MLVATYKLIQFSIILLIMEIIIFIILAYSG